MLIFEEIKKDFESNDKNKLYYRSFDYARAIALTKLIEELSQNEDFRIISAHPAMIHNRSIEAKKEMNESKIFAIGLWCSWLIGDTHYYLQIEKNPFFDTYFTIGNKIDNKHEKCTHPLKINDTFYDGIGWNANPETIEKLYQNLKKALKETKPRMNDWYTHEIQSYSNPYTKQSIYEH